MTPTVPISAPPFHVQSTAAMLRSDFPYFSHHDSVSALWSQKWRGPCERGIYPFTDGKAEDFDPVFAELVRLSSDNADIFLRPDDYAKPFLPIGEKLALMAEEAEKQGDTAKACELYLRAAAVFRISRFPINRSPLGQEAWQKGKAAYVKGARYLTPPIVPVDLPFTHADVNAGDSDVAIQTYLRLPSGERPEQGWPTLLFIPK